MTTTLITVLGRPGKDASGQYRRASYAFANGKKTEPLAFFGWALNELIRPDRMVIIGTSGSAWDHLVEGDLDLGDSGLLDREALIDASSRKSVTQDHLDKLSPYLSKTLGCSVELKIIPHAQNEHQQIAILELLAKWLGDNETVHIDVTHGFRHLPMILLLAALYLRRIKNAHIEKVWYAAFDPDTNEAPVLDLSGLLRLAEGLQAVSSYDADGNYSVFIPILEQSGVPSDIIDALRQGAYYENILNVGAATAQLRRVNSGLQSIALNPEMELLYPLIQERMQWVNEDKQFQKITRLARGAFERRDYLRAILYAYESVITRICQQQKADINDFDARENAQKKYQDQIQSPEIRSRYKLLKNLRNQVAHGTRGSKREVQQALLNEEKMHTVIDGLIRDIENGRLP